MEQMIIARSNLATTTFEITDPAAIADALKQGAVLKLMG